VVNGSEVTRESVVGDFQRTSVSFRKCRAGGQTSHRRRLQIVRAILPAKHPQHDQDRPCHLVHTRWSHRHAARLIHIASVTFQPSPAALTVCHDPFVKIHVASSHPSLPNSSPRSCEEPPFTVPMPRPLTTPRANGGRISPIQKQSNL
jgi:hypothetical protein